MILCVIIAKEQHKTRHALRAIDRPGVAAAQCSTAGTILYINAFRQTSVAGVAVIFAAAPFLTAALGWLAVRLREAWTTIAASGVALLGISIVVEGAVIDGRLSGDLLAFGMTVCIAVMMLIIRQHRQTPMLPAACLSALLCPLLVWPFAEHLQATSADMAYLFRFGTTQFGLGSMLLMLGGHMVSATENALINTLEAPLTVARVWLTFNETPSNASLAGG